MWPQQREEGDKETRRGLLDGAAVHGGYAGLTSRHRAKTLLWWPRGDSLLQGTDCHRSPGDGRCGVGNSGRRGFWGHLEGGTCWTPGTAGEVLVE